VTKRTAPAPRSKRAEIRLRQDEQALRQITDAIAQTIHVLSPDGSFVYANRSLLDYTGLPMDEVLAPDFFARLFHPEDVARCREALRRAVPFESEQRLRRRDGEYRWFLLRFRPFHDEQGRLVHWYATGTDIDDRKRAEERMRNENLALREDLDRVSMVEEIVGSSDALRQVLA
jgi:formate hydrogenlyase transcriptional activator